MAAQLWRAAAPLGLIAACFIWAGKASPLLAAVKRTFEDDFTAKCSNYPFVKSFRELFSPRHLIYNRRFLVYLYDHASLDNGGHGDRMAGLISAVAIAIRTKRTLVVQTKDLGFAKLFQPYFGPGYATFGGKQLNWRTIDNLMDSAAAKEQLTSTSVVCVNAYKTKTDDLCGAFDTDFAQNIVRYSANRVYLCDYLLNPHMAAHSDTLRMLGIDAVTPDVDLAEVMGCMLRLVLWPRPELWAHIDKEYLRSVPALTNISSIQQYGIHYRCGDAAFGKNNASTTSCKVMIGGMDDGAVSSMGGPESMAKCFKQFIDESNATTAIATATTNMLYITSDSLTKANDINRMANFDNVVSSSAPSCDINVDKSTICFRKTIVAWTMLALSRFIIPQVYTSVEEDGYHRRHHVGIFSAFPRFAGLYGLKDDPFRYALHCNATIPNKQIFRIAENAPSCAIYKPTPVASKPVENVHKARSVSLVKKRSISN